MPDLPPDELPLPTTIAAVADAVHENIVRIAIPVQETLSVRLQQQAILAQQRESWTRAQDHVVPATASRPTLAGAEAWMSGALEGTIAALLPEQSCAAPRT